MVSNLLWKGALFSQFHANIVSYYDNSAILIATKKNMNVEERGQVSVMVFILKGLLKYYADVKENNVKFFSLDEIEGSIISPHFQKNILLSSGKWLFTISLDNFTSYILRSSVKAAVCSIWKWRFHSWL